MRMPTSIAQPVPNGHHDIHKQSLSLLFTTSNLLRAVHEIHWHFSKLRKRELSGLLPYRSILRVLAAWFSGESAPFSIPLSHTAPLHDCGQTSDGLLQTHTRHIIPNQNLHWLRDTASRLAEREPQEYSASWSTMNTRKQMDHKVILKRLSWSTTCLNLYVYSINMLLLCQLKLSSSQADTLQYHHNFHH